MIVTLAFAKLNLFLFAAACNLPADKFLFFPRWWEYLEGKLDPLGHCVPDINFPNDVWLIGLAMLHILIILAGFLTVISIIVAGIELIASEGNSEKAINARNRIINSMKGLALAIIATAAVAFLGDQLGGSGTVLPHAEVNLNKQNNVINVLLNIVFVIVGAITFLFMVIAGLRFVLARGEPNKLAEARKQIVYALIGLILVVSAATIVNVVLSKI